MTSNGIYLIKYADHAIKRHVKVIGSKSPYDGDWVYWGKRLSKVSDKPSRVIKLLKMQKGRCDYCKLYFRSDDVIEVHHRDENRSNNNIKNLAMMHGHCHDCLH
ncbi:HNH endonuclease signature motif containing protein [Wolbachia endosymbiont (group E) of Neria commutata]